METIRRVYKWNEYFKALTDGLAKNPQYEGV